MNDRLIKESDVLKAIDKRIKELSKHPEFVRKNGHIDVIGVKKYILAIPSADRPQGWIPCSERLPEEYEWLGTRKFGTTKSDEVYVTFESPKGERFCKHLSFQNGELSRHDQLVIDALAKGSKPIAWMPLPNPWKGADNE